jgi:hypothetical protein
MGDAIAFALNALQQISALVEAGAEVKGLVDHTSSALQTMQAEKRDPTPAEWDELNKQVNALRAQLHG